MALNLKKLILTDDFVRLIDDLNANFEQLALNGGGGKGPSGRRGIQGMLGDRGIAGPQGIDGPRGSRIFHGALLSTTTFTETLVATDIFIEANTRKVYEYNGTEWVFRVSLTTSDDGINGMQQFVPTTFESSPIVEPPPMISTMKTDSTLMLSNIYMGDDEVPTAAPISSSESVAQKVPLGSDSPELMNYRLKIYNGDPDDGVRSEGGHMHLGNSVAMTAKDADGWMQRSGFTISSDWDGENTEILRFTGIATSDAHAHIIEFNDASIKIGDLTITNQGDIRVGTGNSGLKFEINDGILIGDTDVEKGGVIRWTGTKFQGYNDTEWIDLGGSNVITVVGPGQEGSGPIYVDGDKVGIGMEDTFCAMLNIAGSVMIGEHMEEMMCAGTMQYKDGHFLGRNDEGEWVRLDFVASYNDDDGFTVIDEDGNEVQIGSIKVSIDDSDMSSAKFKGLRLKSTDDTVQITMSEVDGIAEIDLSARGLISLNHYDIDPVPNSFPNPVPETVSGIELVSPDCSITITPKMVTDRINETTGESLGNIAQYQLEFNVAKQLINMQSRDGSVKITKIEPDGCDDCDEGVTFDLSVVSSAVCNIIRYTEVEDTPGPYKLYSGVTSADIISVKFESATMEGEDVTTAPNFVFKPTSGNDGSYQVNTFMVVNPIWDITGGDTLRSLIISLYLIKNGIIYSLIGYQRYMVDSNSTVFPIAISGADIINLDVDDEFEVGVKVEITGLEDVQIGSAFVSMSKACGAGGGGGTDLDFSWWKLYDEDETLIGTHGAEAADDTMQFIAGAGITLEKVQLDDDTWAIKITGTGDGTGDGSDRDYSHVHLLTSTGITKVNDIRASANDSILKLKEGSGITLTKGDNGEVVISGSGGGGAGDIDYSSLKITTRTGSTSSINAAINDDVIKFLEGPGIKLTIENGQVKISIDEGDEDTTASQCNVVRYTTGGSVALTNPVISGRIAIPYANVSIAGDGVESTTGLVFKAPHDGRFHVHASVWPIIRQSETAQDPMIPTYILFALRLYKNGVEYSLLDSDRLDVPSTDDFTSGRWFSGHVFLNGQDTIELAEGDEISLGIVVNTDLVTIDTLLLTDGAASIHEIKCGDGLVSGGGGSGDDIDFSRALLISRTGGAINATQNDDTLKFKEGSGIRLVIEGGAIKISTDGTTGSGGGGGCNVVRKTDGDGDESTEVLYATGQQSLIIPDVSIDGDGVLSPTSGAFKFTPIEGKTGVYNVSASAMVYPDLENLTGEIMPTRVTTALYLVKNGIVYSTLFGRDLNFPSDTPAAAVEHIWFLGGSDTIELTENDVLEIAVSYTDDLDSTNFYVSTPVVSLFATSCGTGGESAVGGTCTVGVYRTQGCSAIDVTSAVEDFDTSGLCSSDGGKLFPLVQLQPEDGHESDEGVFTGTLGSGYAPFSFTPNDGKDGHYQFNLMVDTDVTASGAHRVALMMEVYDHDIGRIKVKELCHKTVADTTGNHSLVASNTVYLGPQQTVKFFVYVGGNSPTNCTIRQANISFYRVICGVAAATEEGDSCTTRNKLFYYYSDVFRDFPDEMQVEWDEFYELPIPTALTAPSGGTVSHASDSAWSYSPSAEYAGEYDVAFLFAAEYANVTESEIPEYGYLDFYLLYDGMEEYVYSEKVTPSATPFINFQAHTRLELDEGVEVKAAVKFRNGTDDTITATQKFDITMVWLRMEQVSGCDTDYDFGSLAVYDADRNLKAFRNTFYDNETINLQEGDNIRIDHNAATGMTKISAIVPEQEECKINVARFSSSGGGQQTLASGASSVLADFKSFGEDGTTSSGTVTATPFSWRPAVDQGGWYDLDAFAHFDIDRTVISKSGIVITAINTTTKKVTLSGDHTTGTARIAPLDVLHARYLCLTFTDPATGMTLTSDPINSATLVTGNTEVVFTTNENLSLITTSWTASWVIPFFMVANIYLYKNGVVQDVRSFLSDYSIDPTATYLGKYMIAMSDVVYLSPSDTMSFKLRVELGTVYSGDSTVIPCGMTSITIHNSGVSMHKEACGGGGSGSTNDIDFSVVEVRSPSSLIGTVTANKGDDKFSLVAGSNIGMSVVGKNITISSTGGANVTQNLSKYKAAQYGEDHLVYNVYGCTNTSKQILNFPHQVYEGDTVQGFPFNFTPGAGKAGWYQYNVLVEMTQSDPNFDLWSSGEYELFAYKNGELYQPLGARRVNWRTPGQAHEYHVTLQGSDIVYLEEGDLWDYRFAFKTNLNTTYNITVLPHSYCSHHLLPGVNSSAASSMASSILSSGTSLPEFVGGRWTDNLVLSFASGGVPQAIPARTAVIPSDDAVALNTFKYQPSTAGVYEVKVNFDGATSGAPTEFRVMVYKNGSFYETLIRQRHDLAYIYEGGNSTIQMNGDDDYFEIMALSDTASTGYTGTVSVVVSLKGV